MLTNHSPAERLNARAGHEGWPTICDDRGHFDSAILSAVDVVWQAARGDKRLPMRCDFKARAIGRHLRDITFVDSIKEPGGRRRFRFGFYGSGLARYTGEFTGRFLDEIIPEAFLANWTACFDTAMEVAAPLRIVSQFHALNLDYMTTETMLAPIGDADGAPCGLLISAAYSPGTH